MVGKYIEENVGNFIFEFRVGISGALGWHSCIWRRGRRSDSSNASRKERNLHYIQSEWKFVSSVAWYL